MTASEAVAASYRADRGLRPAISADSAPLMAALHSRSRRYGHSVAGRCGQDDAIYVVLRRPRERRWLPHDQHARRAACNPFSACLPALRGALKLYLSFPDNIVLFKFANGAVPAATAYGTYIYRGYDSDSVVGDRWRHRRHDLRGDPRDYGRDPVGAAIHGAAHSDAARGRSVSQTRARTRTRLPACSLGLSPGEPWACSRCPLPCSWLALRRRWRRRSCPHRGGAIRGCVAAWVSMYQGRCRMRSSASARTRLAGRLPRGRTCRSARAVLAKHDTLFGFLGYITFRCAVILPR
jgi:hypothetical protein